MKFEDFFELVTKKCSEPILIDCDNEIAITDFSEMILIYEDGRFSNSGESIYFHPELGFVRYEWSNWQPGWSAYYKISGEQIVEMLFKLNEEHFARLVEGLKKLREQLPNLT